MKLTSFSALLIASSLLTGAAFAQNPPAAAQQATPVTAPTPAAEIAPAAEAAPAAAVAPAAGNALSQKVLDAIGTPKEGKALVVFFRPSKFAGAAIKYKVREGEVELGQLSSGRYFVAQVEPGTHTYVVHSEAKDVTNIETEAGETYFLLGSVSMGFMAGHPNLSPSDAAAFEAAMGKMKRIMTAE
jgi:hypothetical protein